MNIFAKKFKRACTENELLNFIDQFELDALIIQYRYEGIKQDVISVEDHITEKLKSKLYELKSK